VEKLSVKVLYKGINLDENYRLQKSESFQNDIAAYADANRATKWAKPWGADGWQRCARYDLKRPAPSRIQHFFDNTMPDFCYYETTTYHDKVHGTWSIEPHKPSFLSSWVKARGKLNFRQEHNDVARYVDGKVEVNMPFPLSAFNGYVARYIVDLTQKGLIKAAALTPQWVRSHGIPA
jgi:hypothetical protein